MSPFWLRLLEVAGACGAWLLIGLWVTRPSRSYSAKIDSERERTNHALASTPALDYGTPRGVGLASNLSATRASAVRASREPLAGLALINRGEGRAADTATAPPPLGACSRGEARPSGMFERAESAKSFGLTGVRGSTATAPLLDPSSSRRGGSARPYTLGGAR